MLDVGCGGQHDEAVATAEAHLVTGKGRKIGDERAEAVHRQAIIGALALGLALGGLAAETVALATGEARRACAAARS